MIIIIIIDIIIIIIMIMIMIMIMTDSHIIRPYAGGAALAGRTSASAKLCWTPRRSQ